MSGAKQALLTAYLTTLLLLSMFIWALQGAAPTIRAVTNARGQQTFGVAFEPGAVWGCTYFQEQRVREEERKRFADGKYQPHKCGGLDPRSRFYEENWDYIQPYDSDWLVWAEIGYCKVAQCEPGEEPRYVSTEKLTVHR